MTEDLDKKRCIPCEAGMSPMSGSEVNLYLGQLAGWELLEGKRIKKEYKFDKFKAAMDFVNKVANIAESEGHHPGIFISYNKVKLTLTTHAIDGLSQNDFILAAKINQIS